jgi:hypothetical protein
MRQSLLMSVSATVSLVVVVAGLIVGEAMGLTIVSQWFGHAGLFTIPWVFLTVLIFIPLAIIDDRRQSKSR